MEKTPLGLVRFWNLVVPFFKKGAGSRIPLETESLLGGGGLFQVFEKIRDDPGGEKGVPGKGG